MRRAGAVGAYENLDVLDLAGGDLLERLLNDRDLICSGIRARVAGAQHPSERFAGLIAVREQRVKAVAALERAGRALLVRMGCQQRRVDLDRDSLWCSRELPDVLARTSMRSGQPVQQPGRGRDLIDDSKRGRVRRYRPEQRVLIAHRAHVGEAVSAVSEHHREVTDHAARIVTGPPLLQTRQPRQRLREPALVRDLRQQRATRV